MKGLKMSNSEHAQKYFDLEISNYKQLIEMVEKYSQKTSFISDVDASNLMGISYGDVNNMVKNKEIIFYKPNVFTIIPKFQFNEDGTINPLFKELLDTVHNDLDSERGKTQCRNLVFYTLMEYFGFHHENEFGGKSYTEIRGFEYILKFGSEGVKRVAESIHRTIYHEMGM